MKKRKLFFCFVLTPIFSFAQNKVYSGAAKMNIHPSDHFVFQLSSDRWLGAPDSIDDRRRGASRGANIYFMLDRPFKSNKHFSTAFGLGISTSHVFLEKTQVALDNNTTDLRFINVEGKNYFKKYKIATTYLEIPVELRFSSRPENPSKSLKIALGGRVGTLLNAHSKGKTLKDPSGNNINGATQKVSSKNYFNNNRISATVRIGYGNCTLFGAYALNNVLKDAAGADMRLLQVGLTFSGL